MLGASLLSLFVASAPWSRSRASSPPGIFYPLGFNTILIAHIMFNISYVVVTVRARIQGFDRNLEEAAMDLGANEWTTFWKVTFPLIRPGHHGRGLLAFSLSIDDFIITNFTSGLVNTFPVWIWGTIRNNLPPQVHVIGTAIFVIAVGFVAISTVMSAPRRRSAGRPPPGDRLIAPSPSQRTDDPDDTRCRRSPAALPDHSVVPAVWGRITNLEVDHGEGSWLVTPRRRALPRLHARGSA